MSSINSILNDWKEKSKKTNKLDRIKRMVFDGHNKKPTDYRPNDFFPRIPDSQSKGSSQNQHTSKSSINDETSHVLREIDNTKALANRSSKRINDKSKSRVQDSDEEDQERNYPKQQQQQQQKSISKHNYHDNEENEEDQENRTNNIRDNSNKSVAREIKLNSVVITPIINNKRASLRGENNEKSRHHQSKQELINQLQHQNANDDDEPANDNNQVEDDDEVDEKFEFDRNILRNKMSSTAYNLESPSIVKLNQFNTNNKTEQLKQRVLKENKKQIASPMKQAFENSIRRKSNNLSLMADRVEKIMDDDEIVMASDDLYHQSIANKSNKSQRAINNIKNQTNESRKSKSMVKSKIVEEDKSDDDDTEQMNEIRIQTEKQKAYNSNLHQSKQHQATNKSNKNLKQEESEEESSDEDQKQIVSKNLSKNQTRQSRKQHKQVETEESTDEEEELDELPAKQVKQKAPNNTKAQRQIEDEEEPVGHTSVKQKSKQADHSKRQQHKEPQNYDSDENDEEPEEQSQRQAKHKPQQNNTKSKRLEEYDEDLKKSKTKQLQQNNNKIQQKRALKERDASDESQSDEEDEEEEEESKTIGKTFSSKSRILVTRVEKEQPIVSRKPEPTPATSSKNKSKIEEVSNTTKNSKSKQQKQTNEEELEEHFENINENIVPDQIQSSQESEPSSKQEQQPSKNPVQQRPQQRTHEPVKELNVNLNFEKIPSKSKKNSIAAHLLNQEENDSKDERDLIATQSDKFIRKSMLRSGLMSSTLMNSMTSVNSSAASIFKSNKNAFTVPNLPLATPMFRQTTEQTDKSIKQVAESKSKSTSKKYEADIEEDETPKLPNTAKGKKQNKQKEIDAEMENKSESQEEEKVKSIDSKKNPNNNKPQPPSLFERDTNKTQESRRKYKEQSNSDDEIQEIQEEYAETPANKYVKSMTASSKLKQHPNKSTRQANSETSEQIESPSPIVPSANKQQINSKKSRVQEKPIESTRIERETSRVQTKRKYTQQFDSENESTVQEKPAQKQREKQKQANVQSDTENDAEELDEEFDNKSNKKSILVGKQKPKETSIQSNNTLSKQSKLEEQADREESEPAEEMDSRQVNELFENNQQFEPIDTMDRISEGEEEEEKQISNEMHKSVSPSPVKPVKSGTKTEIKSKKQKENEPKRKALKDISNKNQEKRTVVRNKKSSENVAKDKKSKVERRRSTIYEVHHEEEEEEEESSLRRSKRVKIDKYSKPVYEYEKIKDCFGKSIMVSKLIGFKRRHDEFTDFIEDQFGHKNKTKSAKNTKSIPKKVENKKAKTLTELLFDRNENNDHFQADTNQSDDLHQNEISLQMNKTELETNKINENEETVMIQDETTQEMQETHLYIYAHRAESRSYQECTTGVNMAAMSNTDGVISIEPNKSTVTNQHDNQVLYVVQKGSVIFSLNGSLSKHVMSDVIKVPAKLNYKIKNVGSENAFLYFEFKN